MTDKAIDPISLDDLIYKLNADEIIEGFTISSVESKRLFISIEWKSGLTVSLLDDPFFATQKAHVAYLRLSNTAEATLKCQVTSADVEAATKRFGLSVDDVNPMPTGVNAEDVLK